MTISRQQKTGTRVDIQCPEAVQLYNFFMAGVDKNDQLRWYYAVRTKSNKNYKYIFWFLFDVAIVNAFILYQRVPTVGKKLTLKEFHVELAKQMIGTYNSRKYHGRPTTREAQSSAGHRRMKLPHYPTRATQGRYWYCSSTHGTTTWYCSECQLRLCHTGDAESDCFLKHHLSGHYSQP